MPYPQRRRLLLSGEEVSPLDIPGLKWWQDFRYLDTLFQDAARTTPVVSSGDVTGGSTDKSGQGNHATQATTASKPLWTLAVPSYAAHDLSDDSLSVTLTDANPGTLLFGNVHGYQRQRGVHPAGRQLRHPARLH